MMDKQKLRAAILDRLAADLDLQLRAANLARDEAISEESKAENKYDTRAQEAAYLAQGQARQAAEIQEAMTLYQQLPMDAINGSVTLGALVELGGAGGERFYFFGPRAGGLDVEIDGTSVTVVTPASPLGRQLFGRRVGDQVSLPGRTRPVLQTIMAIY